MAERILDEMGIQTLSKVAEITPRTIRFYLSIDILPHPSERGPAAKYGSIHVERLQAIERLKGMAWRLSDMQLAFGFLLEQNWSDEEISNFVLTESEDTVEKLLNETYAKSLVKKEPVSREEFRKQVVGQFLIPKEPRPTRRILSPEELKKRLTQ